MFGLFCKCDCRAFEQRLDELKLKNDLIHGKLHGINAELAKVQTLLTLIDATLRAQVELDSPKPKGKK